MAVRLEPLRPHGYGGRLPPMPRRPRPSTGPTRTG